ncbi:GNAT family N-acetyltransferase [Histidinibacterium aquaticum]|uniref:GNAT family N-acetyltransferase n=1 Tax=Histidinibacterium aquaticum TaxID=2613962 RepID=A0A5J5GFN2_9RHOB|nr:GNAT family N-acetyltransferase [Histidinibacterium aquaticum]KAA9007039.1 GNAT family N-acetyltransferase [Histidinibacterium aquaticum]
MIRVGPSDPRDPGPRALLEASHALMQSLYPAEHNHYLSVEELTSDDIRFFAATEGDDVLGTGALAIREGYGEVKSMFTAEAARGRGVGAMILVKLAEEARALGLPLMRLETGNTLDAAHRLYARAGFVSCGAFGEYPEETSSIFMEKPLP